MRYVYCMVYMRWVFMYQKLSHNEAFFSYTFLVSVMYVFFVYKICFWFNVNGKRTSMEILTFCHSYFAINFYWRDVRFEDGFGDGDLCKQTKSIQRLLYCLRNCLGMWAKKMGTCVLYLHHQLWNKFLHQKVDQNPNKLQDKIIN